MNLVIFDKDSRVEMTAVGVVVAAIYAAGFVSGLLYVGVINLIARHQ